ncbi:MAG: tripartite tricarboxylate transporter substrate binding protein [Treponema sp.]|nr:tripartite tricarboxylate transporter substrate binding protein [Treponema sp.]
MKRSVLIAVLLMASAAMIFAAGGRQAAGKSSTFPAKEITIVVGAAAGGSSDMTSRTIGRLVETDLGKPVIVNNKPGGSCSVGMQYAAAQAPDGYTVMYLPVELAMVRTAGIANIGVEAFEYIGRVAMMPAALTVAIDAPYNNIKEFIDYAKANPGKVRVGNSGVGSIWHVAAAYLEQKCGVTLNHIPFEGAAPAVTALMGKHIEAVTVNASEVKAGIDAGKLKMIGVMSEVRDPAFPNVPTLKESGYDIMVNAWGGFGVPVGTPENVKKVLADSIAKAANSDTWKTFAKDHGILPLYQNPADFKTFVNDQTAFFKNVLTTLGLAK